MELRGRTAVVTGAAHGIGRAASRHLARAGCRLALVDADPDGLGEALAELSEADAPVTKHLLDVSDWKVTLQLPENVLEQHGAVDILVNNAGVALNARFEDCDLDDFDRVMGVNFGGVVRMCHAFLPHLRARREAAIVQVLSGFALIGFAGKSAYCASKAAVRAFTQALRAELAPGGVRLIEFYPGPVDTGFIARGRARDPAQLEAEARFVAERGLSVDRVAQRLVGALRGRRTRVFVGLEPRLADFVSRLSPGLAHALVLRAQRRLPWV